MNLTRAVREGDIKTTSSWIGSREDVVVIRRGELLLGKLCKATLGGGTSLVHHLWKDISPWAAAKFVSDAQRIGNFWNHMDAPCIGIRDCIVSDDVDGRVDELVANAMGKAAAVEDSCFSEDIKEVHVSGILQDVLRSAGSLVLRDMDEDSALATVVLSGAKGNALNLSQISAVVGQQTIDGRRVSQRNSRIGPRGMICFAPGDKRPEARGFVASSYLNGQNPYEFFHCMMAGRVGIVATAVETATSGYNQRKMVKIQEGQIVAYDRTIRVTEDNVISLHYGGDDYDNDCDFHDV
jgi:DNA-directed RNA polymerase II subunit RPB1